MLALKTLFRRKIRSLLTIVGVGVGVATLVAVVSVARGFREQFNNFFAAGNAHLVLTRKGAADPFISYLPDSLRAEVAAVDNVVDVHPVVLNVQQIDSMAFFFIYGTTEGSPFLAQVKIVEGRGLHDPSVPERRICVGRYAADHLGIGVGSTLALRSGEYEVVGIYETATRLLASGGLLPFEDAQRTLGLEGSMTSALVQLDAFTAETVARTAATLEAEFDIVEATAPAEFSTAFQEFDLADQAVMVLSVLAVFVGAIGVMNTMLMSIIERTREIGILQAIGWSKAMVIRQILVECLVVCLLGGPLGIVTGVACVEIIGTFGELSWVAGAYDLPLFLEAMAVAIGMGVFGAWYPALRACQITPMQALRYE